MIKSQPPVSCSTSTNLPRLLTFGAPHPDPSSTPQDVNVTSRDVNTDALTESTASKVNSHEEALRTIRRRNYPKVLPDIEKRRSLPPNASFVEGPHRYHNHFQKYRQGGAPPSPPPRTYSTSK
jgi:neuroligin